MSTAITENEFGTKKITPLFWKYSLLALAGQLFQSCSLIADGIFIGNGIGGIGLAAFSIISPLLTFFAAMAGLFTTGAATIAATRLGSGDREGARQIYGTTVAAVLMFSVAFSVLAFFLKVPMLRAFGFRLDLKLLKSSLRIGFATFVIQICTTVATIIINNQIVAFGGGELEIGAFGIINGYIAYLARIILFAVPLLFILPGFFGLSGIWMAQPSADTLAFILAALLIAREYRQLRREERLQ